MFLRDLDYFDSNRHYIIAKENRLEIGHKDELSWLSRLIRRIWKPKEERIEYIVQSIWQHPREWKDYKNH